MLYSRQSLSGSEFIIIYEGSIRGTSLSFGKYLYVFQGRYHHLRNKAHGCLCEEYIPIKGCFCQAQISVAGESHRYVLSVSNDSMCHVLSDGSVTCYGHPTVAMS